MSAGSFRKNVHQLWGDDGLAWLSTLPTITATLAKQWQLTDLHPAPNLSYNYILLGYQNTQPIALKIGFDAHAVEQELAALQAYNGYGCVQLLASDQEHKALLLERATPGQSLKTLFPHDDDRAVIHAVTIMQQLHAAAIADSLPFKNIQDWLALLDNPPSALATSYHIDKARILSKELLATQTAPVLLHGDLHHDNILASNLGWQAIDPKGVLGEAAYEVGAFIRSPYPELLKQADPKQIMLRRLAIFAELLAIDEQRLHAWSYVQAVLAGCWAMQDGQTDAHIAMAAATLLNH